MHDSCIVFDMDETLGFFAQLSRLWLTLQELNNNNLRSRDFYDMCESWNNPDCDYNIAVRHLTEVYSHEVQ